MAKRISSRALSSADTPGIVPALEMSMQFTARAGKYWYIPEVTVSGIFCLSKIGHQV